VSRRFVILLSATTLLLMLALPASASAVKSWRIKNRSGHVCGTAVIQSDGHCAVWSNAGGGNYAGEIPRSKYGWVLKFNDVDGSEMEVYRYRSSTKKFWGAGGEGIAVRTHGRWLIRKRTMEGEGSVPTVYKTVGTAPGRCPGQFALGAAFMLFPVW
jgi:hypothetical protein